MQKIPFGLVSLLEEGSTYRWLSALGLELIRILRSRSLLRLVWLAGLLAVRLAGGELAFLSHASLVSGWPCVVLCCTHVRGCLLTVKITQKEVDTKAGLLVIIIIVILALES